MLRIATVTHEAHLFIHWGAGIACGGILADAYGVVGIGTGLMGLGGALLLMLALIRE